MSPVVRTPRRAAGGGGGDGEMNVKMSALRPDACITQPGLPPPAPSGGGGGGGERGEGGCQCGTPYQVALH